MRIAILSESPADEAAIAVLVRRVVRTPVEVVQPGRFRAGGWPHVLDLVPLLIRSLALNDEADALVVVADANSSTPHTGGHAPGEATGCRYCRLAAAVRRTLDEVGPEAHRLPRVGIGVAVPCFEAWLRIGLGDARDERGWVEQMELARAQDSPRRRIKEMQLVLEQAVYGTTRPSLPVEAEVMAAEMSRILGRDGFREDLVACFPEGLGPLIRELESWSESGK